MKKQTDKWCFTLNNYCDSDIERLNSLDSNPDVVYLIYGKEVAETGTPHLQGLVVFSSRRRRGGVTALLGRAHVSPCVDVESSIAYCKKEGDFTEVGRYQPPQKGKRNDLEAVMVDIIENEIYDMTHYMVNHAAVYMRGEKWIRDMIAAHRPTPGVEPKPLYAWQSKMFATLVREVPDGHRKILFVVDEVGNMGKSWFTTYFRQVSEKNAQCLQPGKQDNLAYLLREDLDVLFIDCPREKTDYLSYSFLEAVKTGEVQSGKYCCTMKYIGRSHVVVFMNGPPDYSKLSSDRYQTIFLKECDKEIVEGSAEPYY